MYTKYHTLSTPEGMIFGLTPDMELHELPSPPHTPHGSLWVGLQKKHWLLNK